MTSSGQFSNKLSISYPAPPRRVQEMLYQKKYFKSDRYILMVWLLLPILNWSIDFFKDRYNNYKIFKYVFWHLIDQSNLYLKYPGHHTDVNHYGPLFSIIIAPFAVTPDIVGCVLWGIFNVLMVYYAMVRLKLKQEYKILLMTLITIELGNAVWSNQFNPSVLALILLSFVCVEEEKDFYAGFWIMLGTFVKLYGIVGLVFFLFSKNKWKFIIGCATWSILFFILPMAISSPSFVVQCYVDWFHALVEKNSSNVMLTTGQDISLMGFVRRTLGDATISNNLFYAFGIPMVLAPLVRFNQYKAKNFRILILSSLLMFIVLFSSSSEHSTYIVCITGVFLWMITQEEIFSKRNIILLVFLLVWTGLSPTDAFSVQVRKFCLNYALKAVPCIVVWILLVKDLLLKDFNKPQPLRFLDQENLLNEIE